MILTTAAIGASIGSMLFPGLGTVIGYFTGLVVGIAISHYIDKGIDAIGDLIVDDDEDMNKEKMYLNALKKLGLKRGASNDDVNKAKKEKWAKYHPDKHVKEGKKEQEYN